MNVHPIVSALAVTLATWLIVATLWAYVIPSGPDEPRVLVALFSYVIAAAAGYWTYRTRKRSAN